jgi:hypothetical protein
MTAEGLGWVVISVLTSRAAAAKVGSPSSRSTDARTVAASTVFG